MPSIMRPVLALLLGIATCTFASTGRTQSTYPERLVTIVVPAAAGSVTDVIARIVGDHLSQNGSGRSSSTTSAAGSNIGSERVATSPPDGYTLLVAPPTPLTIADMVYRSLPYDPQKFVPISVLVRVPNVLLARRDLPVNSVQELIAYAKAHPATMTYGSQGVGTTSYLSFRLLEKLAGIEMVHVPYRGEVPILERYSRGPYRSVLRHHVDVLSAVSG